MNDCKRIQSLIDESERPGVLSYEAEGHISDCVDCRAFADERASLRTLLASAPRISIPTNYDVILRAKLDESRKAKAFSWFSPAGFMQIGAATAGIIIAITASQYLGIFSSAEQPANDTLSHGGVAQNLPAPSESLPEVSKKPEKTEPVGELAQATFRPTRKRSISGRDTERTARDNERTDVDPSSNSFDLLMGKDGEKRVSMTTVSVGAQLSVAMSSNSVYDNSARTAF